VAQAILRQNHCVITPYKVAPEDSVRAIERGPEYANKPDVMGSAKILEVVEQIVMEELRPAMQPHERSLGTIQNVEHCGPILIGSMLSIAACCAELEGKRSMWTVHAHDGYETVYRGRLGFVVIHKDKFEHGRLARKRQYFDNLEN
jgi:predicted thioesterase